MVLCFLLETFSAIFDVALASVSFGGISDNTRTKKNRLFAITLDFGKLRELWLTFIGSSR